MDEDKTKAEDKANALLAQEYLQLQKTVEDFDARALTIKAWSVTFSAGGLGLAYQQHNPILLLIAAASAAIFWTIEGVWKVHQRAFYARIDAIEAHFAGTANTPPFQISAAWRTSFRGDGNRLHSMLRMVPVFWQLGVVLPHILIVAAGILLFRFYPPTPPPAQPQSQHAKSDWGGRLAEGRAGPPRRAAPLPDARVA